jgi:phospholipid N-methyltransferase
VSKKDEVLGVIAGLPMLNEKTKKSRIKYLEKFFELARDEDKLIAMFEKRCHS